MEKNIGELSEMFSFIFHYLKCENKRTNRCYYIEINFVGKQQQY